MSDDISQAVAEEEPITPEAQVPETTPTEETPDEPQTEKPLTLEDVRGLLQQEFIPEVNRTIQSQVAKGENRVTQRISQRIAALDANKGALNLSDADLAQAKRNIIDEETMNAYAQPDEPQADGSQAQLSPEEVIQRNTEYLLNSIDAILDQHGVDIGKNDPEAKLINDALADPNGSYEKTVIAANKAAEAKLARQNAQKKNAAARVPGGGEGKPTNKPLTAEEKISSGLKNKTWRSEEPPPAKK